jgi:predicted RNA-binding Zn-ribbon protein involved in translation (DUF1610 family)
VFVNKDDTLYGDGDRYPIERSEITEIEDAIDLVLEIKGVDRTYVPDQTDQFCVGLKPILRASIVIRDNWKGQDVHIGPHTREIVTEDEIGYTVGDVRTTQYGDPSDYHPVHLKLVELFSETVAGFRDEAYWQGYRNGSWNAGETIEWSDVAWHVFDDRFDGNTDLMLQIGNWMATEARTVCQRSKAWFPVPEWATPTGSYVNTISDVHAGTCPECGADKEDHWECVNSSNRTRVPNTYKCTACGNTKKGITTG